MRARKWRVTRLKEFYPSNPHLLGLNVNRGQELCIRLRSSEHEYFEFDSVLHTLLHELVHIVHGNHSAEFYDMLNVLMKEADLIAFRLAHKIPSPADQYRWGNGHVLGNNNTSMKERSCVVDHRWGNGHVLGNNNTSMKERSCVVDHTCAQDAARAAALSRWSSTTKRTIATTTSPSCRCIIDLTTTAGCIVDLTVLEEDENWTCMRCTYINLPLHLQCFMCCEPQGVGEV